MLASLIQKKKSKLLMTSPPKLTRRTLRAIKADPPDRDIPRSFFPPRCSKRVLPPSPMCRLSYTRWGLLSSKMSAKYHTPEFIPERQHPFPPLTNKQQHMEKSEERNSPSPPRVTTTGVSRLTRPPSKNTVKSELRTAHGSLSPFISVPGCGTENCTTKLHSPRSSDGEISG